MATKKFLTLYESIWHSLYYHLDIRYLVNVANSLAVYLFRDGLKLLERHNSLHILKRVTQVCSTYFRYTFSSNHNFRKSLCSLFFLGFRPSNWNFLVKSINLRPHELLWMLWFDGKIISSLLITLKKNKVCDRWPDPPV